jgi:hypothetical protein
MDDVLASFGHRFTTRLGRRLSPRVVNACRRSGIGAAEAPGGWLRHLAITICCPITPAIVVGQLLSNR